MSTTEAPLKELLQDSARNRAMQVATAGITLDYSHQRLSLAELSEQIKQLDAQPIAAMREAMFKGEPINCTENRAVLHVALRGSEVPNPPWGEAISRQVQGQLDSMLAFAEALRNGQVYGATGHGITDVVNLGIGGSDLGPRMASIALSHLQSKAVKVHYVSNPDAWALYEVLRDLNPQSTLFILASKTMTTQETLTNAATAREWLANAGIKGAAQAAHWVAVTASPEQALKQGFDEEKTFLFWDWVGGRYSVWSTLGLPLAIAIGAEQFRQFLSGARAMDEHFCSAPTAQNMPMLLALLGVYNRDTLKAPTQLLSCYAYRLSHFPAFIQQMDMESNGKSVQRNGLPVVPGQGTGPIVWGGLGIDGQHAYFQLLHQGTHLVPIDFIGVKSEDTPLPQAKEHHAVVTANLQAQARALALGRDAAAEGLPPWRNYHGNVPSNTLWLDQLDAKTLGALIALYEHKVFVQGLVWNINSYDQWGVELGKLMVKEIFDRKV